MSSVARSRSRARREGRHRRRRIRSSSYSDSTSSGDNDSDWSSSESDEYRRHRHQRRRSRERHRRHRRRGSRHGHRHKPRSQGRHICANGADECDSGPVAEAIDSSAPTSHLHHGPAHQHQQHHSSHHSRHDDYRHACDIRNDDRDISERGSRPASSPEVNTSAPLAVRNLAAERSRKLGSIAYDLMNELVEGVLREELIPDILIEVLTQSNSKPGGAYSARGTLSVEEQCALAAYEEVELSAVGDLAEAAVSDVLRDFTDNFLRNVELHRRHPLEVLADDLLAGWMPQLSREVVQLAVHELVSEHFLQKRLNRALLMVITPLVEDVAREAWYDAVMKCEFDSLVSEVLVEECKSVVTVTLAEQADVAQRERAATEHTSIAQAAERMIWSASLRALIDTVANSGTEILMREFMERLLVQQMSRRMLGLACELEATQLETQESVVLGELHTQLTAGPGFDVMLHALDHALTEHEALIQSRETERLGMAVGTRARVIKVNATASAVVTEAK